MEVANWDVTIGTSKGGLIEVSMETFARMYLRHLWSDVPCGMLWETSTACRSGRHPRPVALGDIHGLSLWKTSTAWRSGRRPRPVDLVDIHYGTAATRLLPHLGYLWATSPLRLRATSGRRPLLVNWATSNWRLQDLRKMAGSQAKAAFFLKAEIFFIRGAARGIWDVSVLCTM